MEEDEREVGEEPAEQHDRGQHGEGLRHAAPCRHGCDHEGHGRDHGVDLPAQDHRHQEGGADGDARAQRELNAEGVELEPRGRALFVRERLTASALRRPLENTLQRAQQRHQVAQLGGTASRAHDIHGGAALGRQALGLEPQERPLEVRREGGRRASAGERRCHLVEGCLHPAAQLRQGRRVGSPRVHAERSLQHPLPRGQCLQQQGGVRERLHACGRDADFRARRPDQAEL